MTALFKMYDTPEAQQTATAPAAPAPAPAPAPAARPARPAPHLVQAAPRPVTASVEADMARWMDTMNRLHDPVVARVVLKFMEQNSEVRTRFPGAHLLALETVKREGIRFAKSERRKALAMNALRALGGLLWSGFKLARRMLPALFSWASAEPAHRSLRARLKARQQQSSSASRRG